MRKHLTHIFTILILITIIISGFGHVAHAQTDLIGCARDFNGCVTDIIATVVNMALTVTSWILAISGYLLNFSMNLTLHIKQFIDGTPAIFTVWKAIRDISGMFIIFMLMWAAIKMILSPFGLNAGVGSIVKTVVMAGILINFSFFITGIGIDISNVVSVQLYNAIAPANNLASNTGLTAKNVESTFGDGGISDIFMSALRITNIYDPKTGKLTSDSIKDGTNIGSASIKIILGGVVGIIIMITAALSFFLAAMAFVVRFVILIFLIGFSPMMFASYAIPQLDKYTKKWEELYYSQLTFMPIYLLLMYFAMKILTESTLFGTGYAGDLTNSGSWYANFLVLGVNAVIVIVMLNVPLVAALSMGAKLPEWAGKVKAGDIWGKVGGWARQNSWAYTGGRAASSIARSDRLKDFAASSKVGEIALKGIRGAGASYGKKLDEQVKAKTDFAETLGHNNQAILNLESRLRNLKRQRDRLPSDANTDTPAQAALRTSLRDQINTTETDIGVQKDSRKQSYANRTNTSSPETLWTKVARKDRKAASKVQADIYENRLKDEKDDLKDIKSDLKAIEGAIRNTDNGAGNAVQNAERARLIGRRNTGQAEVDRLEDLLGIEKNNISS